jgi:hypothetical protein
MNLLNLLGQAGLGSLGAHGQKKAANFAYRIYRATEAAKGNRKVPEWEDMTQREQERWIAAVGDIVDEEMR